MASDQYDFVFGQVLGHEGGYTTNRKDRGNWTSGVIGKGQLKGTKYGISAMSYPDLDIKSLTTDQAKAIYRRDFWNRLKLDQVPAGVDLAMFDFAVNSGQTRAAEFVQTCVDAKVDGLVGRDTIAAINAHDPAELVNELCDRRMDFLRHTSSWPTFGDGWTKRVKGVRKVALQMVVNEKRAASLPDHFPQDGDAIVGGVIVREVSDLDAPQPGGLVVSAPVWNDLLMAYELNISGVPYLAIPKGNLPNGR